MERRRERAFTLLELMVVVAIIGILIALLMPGVSSAWDVARMTQCQSNLANLFKAHMSWLADRDATSEGTLNAGWAGTLKTYLEGKTSQLRCPSALIVSTGAGGGGTGETGGTNPGTVQDEAALGADEIMIMGQEPDITLDDVTIGVTDSGGNLKYEIPIGPSSYWTMYQSWSLPDGRLHIESNLDRDLSKGPDGRYKDDDFVFDVEYRGDRPAKVTIGYCDGSANTSYGLYSDFRVNHQAIWDGQRFANMFALGHHGETVDLMKEMEKNGTISNKVIRKMAYACWTIMSASKATLGATSYGLSRGSYHDWQGRYVARSDPKLFFILDYPKAVADYTDIGDTLPDGPYWDRIFIDPAPPPEDWAPPPGLEDRTWEEVQALRHLGKANVLFCDGHVEALGPEDLGASNPLWRSTGR